MAGGSRREREFGFEFENGSKICKVVYPTENSRRLRLSLIEPSIHDSYS